MYKSFGTTVTSRNFTLLSVIANSHLWIISSQMSHSDTQVHSRDPVTSLMGGVTGATQLFNQVLCYALKSNITPSSLRLKLSSVFHLWVCLSVFSGVHNCTCNHTSLWCHGAPTHCGVHLYLTAAKWDKPLEISIKKKKKSNFWLLFKHFLASLKLNTLLESSTVPHSLA